MVVVNDKPRNMKSLQVAIKKLNYIFRTTLNPDEISPVA